MKRGRVSVAFVAVAVVIAGCSLGEALQDPGDPVDMTTATIAGTWHGGTERFITFAEDGTFTALNLPPEMFGTYDDPAEAAEHRVDGSGHYNLDHAAMVELVIDHRTEAHPATGGTVTLKMSALRPGDGQVYLVLFYEGSQGNMTTGYLKCADDCVLPSRPTSKPS